MLEVLIQTMLYIKIIIMVNWDHILMNFLNQGIRKLYL